MLGAAGQLPSVAQYGELRYLLRCVNESMRLYPHPPVLLRRAQVADTLPGARARACSGADACMRPGALHPP